MMPGGHADALADDDRAIEVRPSDDDYISKRTGIRRLIANAEGALSETSTPETPLGRV